MAEIEKMNWEEQKQQLLLQLRQVWLHVCI